MLSLFAHSRHIALPPVFVYGFGAIFGKITAIEPPKISRSISDRVDYLPTVTKSIAIIGEGETEWFYFCRLTGLYHTFRNRGNF